MKQLTLQQKINKLLYHNLPNSLKEILLEIISSNTNYGIQTTSTSSNSVVVDLSLATAYRLESGVSTVKLPKLAGNAGTVIFLVNDTGVDVELTSFSGGNDIWSGGDSVSIDSVPQSTPLRILHDGTQWIIL